MSGSRRVTRSRNIDRGAPTIKRAVAIVLTTLATAIAVLFAPTAAYADPVVPQPDTPCLPNLADAMTWLPEQKINLVCLQQPNQRYQWIIVTSDYPSSDRWLTYGPQLTLRGEGTRNRNLRSGDWIALPQDPDSQCIAEQIAVVSAGVVSSPQVEAGTTGQQLSFRVLPNLFSITMKGYCLWTKLNS
jgi:hypothetical protein